LISTFFLLFYLFFSDERCIIMMPFLRPLSGQNPTSKFSVDYSIFYKITLKKNFLFIFPRFFASNWILKILPTSFLPCKYRRRISCRLLWAFPDITEVFRVLRLTIFKIQKYLFFVHRSEIGPSAGNMTPRVTKNKKKIENLKWKIFLLKKDYI
jgi:hypothetical protein